MTITAKKFFIRGIIIISSLLIIVMIWGYVSYKDYITVPSKRLDMGSYYQEMVPDEKHIYIEMPLDHNLSSFLMSFPMMDATKVRMFKLHGEDLLKYVNNSGEINIAYEWEKVMLQEYIDQTESSIISVPTINLLNQRSKYKGEVLLLNGIEDNVFAPEMAKLLGMTYPNARAVLFQDTHAMNYNNKEYQKIRAAFFTTGLYSEEIEGLIKKNGRLQ